MAIYYCPEDDQSSCRNIDKLSNDYQVQCLQAYGFIRISYGITLENTEYGENNLICGFHSRSTSQSKWPTANVSRVLAQVGVVVQSVTVLILSLLSVSDSEHESSYASSSL